MVALMSKSISLVFDRGDEIQCAGSRDGERPVFGLTGSLNSSLFRKNALIDQRLSLLERLAECANEIKRIDEQLKVI
jgi:hypothetical protein